MEKKVIFWDFDGTLVKPNEAFTITLDSVLRRFGYEIAFDELRRCIGSVVPWHTSKTVYPHAKESGFWPERFREMECFYESFGVKAEDFGKINSEYITLLPGFGYSVYADASSALSECADRGYELYILSNNFPELPKTVKKLGLDVYFKDYYISAMIGYDKPRREIFDFAIRRSGYPETAYMAGDNLYADIAGAAACGIKTIWINRSGIDPGDIAPDHICSSLSEVPGLMV